MQTSSAPALVSVTLKKSCSRALVGLGWPDVALELGDATTLLGT